MRSKRIYVWLCGRNSEGYYAIVRRICPGDLQRYSTPRAISTAKHHPENRQKPSRDTR